MESKYIIKTEKDELCIELCVCVCMCVFAATPLFGVIFRINLYNTEINYL